MARSLQREVRRGRPQAAPWNPGQPNSHRAVKAKFETAGSMRRIARKGEALNLNQAITGPERETGREEPEVGDLVIDL